MNLDDLKQLRQKKGLTQMRIANLVGVTLNAYLRWENGCGKPTPENFEKLEKILSE